MEVEELVGGRDTFPTGLEMTGPTSDPREASEIPTTPRSTRKSEATHHFISGGRFALGRFTSPSLILDYFEIRLSLSAATSEAKTGESEEQEQSTHEQDHPIVT